MSCTFSKYNRFNQIIRIDVFGVLQFNLIDVKANKHKRKDVRPFVLFAKASKFDRS